MFNNEKVMFIGKNEKEIKELCTMLNEMFGITYTTKKQLDTHLIVAKNNFDYELGIVAANLLATVKEYNVNWLDIDDTAKKLNKTLIFYFHVKKNKEAEMLQKIFEFKRDFELATSITLYTNYFPSAASCFVYIKLTDLFLGFTKDNIHLLNIGNVIKTCNKVLEKIIEFSNTYSLPEELKISSFDFKGKPIVTKKEIEIKKMEKLKQYFYISTLYLGLKDPLGCNLLPKSNEIDEDVFGNLYLEPLAKYDCISNIPNLVNEESGIRLDLTIYTNYIEIETKIKNRNEYLEQKIEITDILHVDCKIEILDDTKLIVKSDVVIERIVSGDKILKQPAVYDALLKNSDYITTKFNFSITDYFEIIDLNLLLHYTDASKSYETYHIPIGFDFTYGIEKLKMNSMVYADEEDEEWFDYNDISEVKKYLLSEK